MSEQYQWGWRDARTGEDTRQKKPITPEEAMEAVKKVIADRKKLEEKNKLSDIHDTLEERGDRYGFFKDGAEIMQSLKLVMHNTKNWDTLSPSQKEALEMIQHKIGRILNGDPDYVDNWTDIAGYATLVEEELCGNVV